MHTINYVHICVAQTTEVSQPAQHISEPKFLVPCMLYVCVQASKYTFKNSARKQVARKADERDLFTFFSECGKVQDVRIIKDTQSRKSKGIAYVEFEKQEQVVAALAKSGQTLCGFPIVVQASQAEKT